MKVYRFFRKFHRWLGLIIGLQVVLWLSGGFVMSFFNIDEVRGTNNKAEVTLSTITTPVNFDSSQLLSSLEFEPTSLVLKQWQGKLVWRAENDNRLVVVDAQNGHLLSPFDLNIAKSVAIKDFTGDGKIIAAESSIEPHYETRGRELPLWKLQFDDPDNTRIYVSPKTGEVVARRNDTWRLFDFFWMLHIMDYEGRDNFNHPLLIIAALLGVLFGLSGIYLVFRTVFFNRRQNGKKA